MGDTTDTSTAAGMPMPPGGPIDIVFSFDTTGSMSGYIEKVKTDVTNIITRLLEDVPFLRIAVFAHGDYGDTPITKHIDFSRDVNRLRKFVQTAGRTGGGDWEECYELVLQEVRTTLSWQPGTQRALVMIGDAIPHDTTYYKNRRPGGRNKKGKGKKATTDEGIIDWKEETRRLHEEMGVRIYAVQCGANDRADFFYKHLADSTGGKRLQLDNFLGITELIMAICYRESGPDIYAAYEREIRDREGAGLRKDLDVMFNHLRAPVSTPLPSTSGSPSLTKADSTSSVGRGRKRARSPSPEESLSSSSEIEEPTAKKSKKTTAHKVLSTKRTPKKGGKTKTGVTAATKKISTKGPSAFTVENFLESHEISQQRREATQGDNFVFAGLDWSRWRLAMAAKSTVLGARGRWRERTAGHTGMRNAGLFEEGRGDPAMYEISVQLGKSAKKHVVLLRSSGGFESRCWDTYLLRDLKMRQKIDHIIKQGHKVYVRRAVLSLPQTVNVEGQKVKISDAEEMRKLMCAFYDYPWTERRSEDGTSRGSRFLRRSGIVISGATKIYMK